MPLPPRASLEGIPPELRDEIFHLVDISTPMHVVSAAKLVAACQESQLEDHTTPNDTPKVQEFLDRGQHHSNARSPIGDLSTLLNLSTALHPLSRTSRQLCTEYRPTHVEPGVSKYRFMMYNFDNTQMAMVSAAINTLPIDKWCVGKNEVPHACARYEVCFVTDDDVVSSVRALCETIQATNTCPSGFYYFDKIGWVVEVRTTMKQEQIREIYEMVGAMAGESRNEKQYRLLGDLQRWFVSLKCEAFTGLS
jgi:hypothetical protein